MLLLRSLLGSQLRSETAWSMALLSSFIENWFQSGFRSSRDSPPGVKMEEDVCMGRDLEEEKNSGEEEGVSSDDGALVLVSVVGERFRCLCIAFFLSRFLPELSDRHWLLLLFSVWLCNGRLPPANFCIPIDDGRIRRKAQDITDICDIKTELTQN